MRPMRLFLAWTVTAVACTTPSPSLEASVEASCAADAGATIRWSSPGADVVLLLEGDRASVVPRTGEAPLATDGTRLIRVAAMRANSTSWHVSKLDACPAPRSGGIGVILRGDGSAAAGQEILINGSPQTADEQGRFSIPGGVEPYSLGYTFTHGLSLTDSTTVRFQGVTVATPMLRTAIGNRSHDAPLTVRVTSDVKTSGSGYETTVTARVRSDGRTGGAAEYLSPAEGMASFPTFSWHGPASTRVTVTAVRQYLRKIVTDDAFDRSDILGASAPVEVELRAGEPAVVDVHVDSVAPDVRDLFLPSELGNVVSYLAYGLPGEGPSLYSSRSWAQSRLPVVPGDGYWDAWAVNEPSPRDGVFEQGTRGSGEFVIPREGAVIAPLYRAPRLPSELPWSAPVFHWDMPQPCLCRAELSMNPRATWVAYSVGPVDLRELGLQFPGTYHVTLDCYPELASVDDLLTGQRGIDFANGVGRRARVQVTGDLLLR